MARAVPIYRSMNMADLITATTKAPMEDVAAAIKNGDAVKFAEAYAQLTATCNACHQSTEHSAVVIQVPKASSYPDQDFQAAEALRFGATPSACRWTALGFRIRKARERIGIEAMGRRTTA